MRRWAFALGGLLVWTAHFFAVWGAASLFPGNIVAAWLIILLTAAGLIAVGVLARVAWQARKGDEEGGLNYWISGLALWSNTLAAVAILYQGLPAILI